MFYFPYDNGHPNPIPCRYCGKLVIQTCILRRPREHEIELFMQENMTCRPCREGAINDICRELDERLTLTKAVLQNLTRNLRALSGS